MMALKYDRNLHKKPEAAPNGGYLIKTKFRTVCRHCTACIPEGLTVWFFPEQAKGQRIADKDGDCKWITHPDSGRRARFVSGRG